MGHIIVDRFFFIFINMENLDEGLEDWAVKKYEEIKSAVQIESKETVLAAKIILKWLRGDKPSEEQANFLKSQSVDISKALTIIGLQYIAPGALSVINFALEPLFKKFDIPFTFYPSSHKKDSTQKFLKRHKVMEIVAEEIEKMMKNMGK